ncbi:hypothetical protein HDV63DRAFT_239255 [Trichoderma sp. SZMC 28014]
MYLQHQSTQVHKHSTSATPSSMAHIISPAPSLGQICSPVYYARAASWSRSREGPAPPCLWTLFPPIIAALSVWWCRSWWPWCLPETKRAVPAMVLAAPTKTLPVFWRFGTSVLFALHSAYRLQLVQRVVLQAKRSTIEGGEGFNRNGTMTL